MRVQDIIRAEKRDVAAGPWRDGPVPRSAFPLDRRNRPYRVPRGTRWRVLSFTAQGEPFRILVLLHEAKGLFRATLGRIVGRDIAILCSYDYDVREPGWHCHVACGPVQGIPPCAPRGPWVRRIPRGGARIGVRRARFGVSLANALAVAADFYRVRGALL